MTAQRFTATEDLMLAVKAIATLKQHAAPLPS